MDANEIQVNMTPSHPGDFIRTEIVEELGLSVTKAAEILGVRRATLSDLLNGNSTLSPEMALRIEKAFAVSMDMLLRMQAWYDTSQMRAQDRRDQRSEICTSPTLDAAGSPLIQSAQTPCTAAALPESSLTHPPAGSSQGSRL